MTQITVVLVLFQVAFLAILVIQHTIATQMTGPPAKLLSLWPLNKQYQNRDATPRNRHATIPASVTLTTGDHFFTWPQGIGAYVEIPELDVPSTDGYFKLYFKMYIDAGGMSGAKAMQIMEFGDTSCFFSVYYTRNGTLAMARTVSGSTVTVSKAFATNTWYGVLVAYTTCQTKPGLTFDCIRIIEYDSFASESTKTRTVSRCPNLYRRLAVGRARVGRVALKGSIYCLAVYSGRVQDGCYPDERPEYLQQHFCSGTCI